MSIAQKFKNQVSTWAALVGMDSNNDPAALEVTYGAAHVYGLARKAVKVGASTTYNSTEILGFLVTNTGGGTWSMTFVDGVAGDTAAVDTDGFTVGQIYPFHLSSLTTPVSAEVVVFIPS